MAAGDDIGPVSPRTSPVQGEPILAGSLPESIVCDRDTPTAFEWKVDLMQAGVAGALNVPGNLLVTIGAHVLLASLV